MSYVLRDLMRAPVCRVREKCTRVRSGLLWNWYHII